MTLDSKSGIAKLSEYKEGPFVQTSFGFTLAFNEPISVALVWDKSAAASSGIRPGMVLTSIKGKPPNLSKDGVQHMFSAIDGKTIHLEWNGGLATLSKKSSVLDK